MRGGDDDDDDFSTVLAKFNFPNFKSISAIQCP